MWCLGSRLGVVGFEGGFGVILNRFVIPPTRWIAPSRVSQSTVEPKCGKANPLIKSHSQEPAAATYRSPTHTR